MFDKLSLAKKLAFGFCSILILLSVVGFISYGALNMSSDGFNDYQDLAEDTDLLSELQANMLMVRMNVLGYLNTGSDSSLEGVYKYWAINEELMAQSTKAFANPERIRLLKEIEENFSEYEAGFTEVVQYTEKTAQQLKVMVPYGDTITTALDGLVAAAVRDENTQESLHASAALNHLLLARIRVYQFLRSSAASADKGLREELVGLDEELNLLAALRPDAEKRELLTQARDAKNAYLAGWLLLAENTYARDKVYNETLIRIGPLVAEQIANIKASVEGDQGSLGSAQLKSNSWAISEILILCGIAIALGIGIAVLITRAILRQMGGEPATVIDVARQVAQGNLDVEVPSRGELPTSLYAAIRLMIDQLQQKARLSEAIAQGDLTQEIKLASENDVLGKSLQQMSANLRDILGNMSVAGEQIASGSSQVADASQSLSHGATEQASSLEEMSASTNQLSSQTSTNADNANKASQLANSAKNVAEQGNQQMAEMVSAMNEINEAGQNISKIIKVIDEIAFQTNLLALNAAVEAARAGQHGKGFAVVAEEVRNLAARSSKAAEETSQLIEGSVAKTTRGMNVATSTSEALKKIVTEITETTDLIGEIAAASREQADGLLQINIGLSQVDEVTQKNTASAEESAAAAEELSSQAAQMKALMSRFHINSAPRTQMKKPQFAPAAPSFSPSSGGGWDELRNEPQMQIAAKQQIRLDDDEFGRF
jgi:methyl-accepting chemotaxis protein